MRTTRICASQPRARRLGVLIAIIAGICALVAPAVRVGAYTSAPSGHLATAVRATPGPQRLAGLVPAAVRSRQAHLVRHLATSLPIQLTVALVPQNDAALQRFVDDVQRPGSPVFHRFLSFAQWKARYAPPDTTVSQVTRWARSHGLHTVQRFSSNLAVVVDGTVGAAEQALHTTLSTYQDGDHQFYANDSVPVIDPPAAGLVRTVFGLDDTTQSAPASGPVSDVTQAQPSVAAGPFRRSEPVLRMDAPRPWGKAARDRAAASTLRRGADGPLTPALCCKSSWLEPPDLWSDQAYSLGALQGLGHCCNPTHAPDHAPKQTSIAIIGQDRVDDADLQAFFGQYGLAANVFGIEMEDPVCCDDETTTDTEWAGAMSNSFGASQDTAPLYVYEQSGTYISDRYDAYQQALSDDSARVLSTSFDSYEDKYGGLFNTSISAFHDITNAMVAEGWSLAAASGDKGAYSDCKSLSVTYPASDPNVVAVGGTELDLYRLGAQVYYRGEKAWYGGGCDDASRGGNGGGGGGGCSNTFVAPTYQPPAITGCTDSDGTWRRALPDISLNAATVQVVHYLGQWTGAGGTSLGAPEMAGFFAQVNAYLAYLGTLGPVCGGPCGTLGNPGHALWFYKSGAWYPRDPYYDITDGCNGGNVGLGYCAGPGWDKATGWGSVNMLQLAWMLMNFDYGPAGDPSVTLSSAVPANHWTNDGSQTVSFSIDPATVGLAGYTAAWDTDPGGDRAESSPGGYGPYWDGPRTLAQTSGSLRLSDAGPGCHTAYVQAWNNLGFNGHGSFGQLCYDPAPPTVSCPQPDDQWNSTDLTLHCTASDDLSGLANPADANFTLSTSTPDGTETTSAYTGAKQICDAAGNCATAGPIGPFKVDKRPPDIRITQPANATYSHDQTIILDYGATDGGSGVAQVNATLDGQTTVAGHDLSDGQTIDLLTGLPTGNHMFTVTATDAVGNSNSASVTFTVTVTAQGIIAELDRFAADGAFTLPGTAATLRTELQAAAGARDTGDCLVSGTTYAAFAQEVHALSGRGIRPDAAGTLAADAQYLIKHCP